MQSIETTLPGLLLIGNITSFGFAQDSGALGGSRVLLTCSEALQKQASDCVRDFGGRPIQRPLISLNATNVALDKIKSIAIYDWVILTSPSAVRCFMELVNEADVDLRKIPKLMVCGSGSANALKAYGLLVDAMPEKGFSAEAILKTAHENISSGSKVLRLRSAKAGSAVAEGLREMGADAEDCIIYTNDPVKYDSLPNFDTVFFASASAVEVFVDQWGTKPLENSTLLTIGKPTVKALTKVGLKPTIVSSEATVTDAIDSLASYHTLPSIPGSLCSSL